MFLLFSSLSSGDVIDWEDLAIRSSDGLYYEKFTDVPFSGIVTGEEQGGHPI